MENPKQENLTKSDWRYIHYHLTKAFKAAEPKPSEGKPSKEFLDQKNRVLDFLISKAY
jgi:hypothetical protein